MCAPNPFRDFASMKIRHDHNAHQTEPLTAIRMRLGMEGVGLFWCLMEIFHAKGGKMAVSEMPVIAYALHVPEARIFELLPLFTYADMFYVYCDTAMNEAERKANRNLYQREYMKGKRQPKREPEPKQSKPSFIPPSLDEVRAFFAEKGYSGADKAYEYYAVNQWRDSHNTPVKNWKSKMIANWMRDDKRVETEPKTTTNTLHAGGNMPVGFAL